MHTTIGESIVAYLDKDLLPYPTIRHTNCHVVVTTSSKVPKCPPCIRYQATLRVLLSREKETVLAVRTDPSSKMNDRWRTTPELKEKMSRLRQLKKVSCERLRRTEAKLSEVIQSEGVQVITCYSVMALKQYVLFFIMVCRWMTAQTTTCFILWKRMLLLFLRSIRKAAFPGFFGSSSCKLLD